MNLKWWRRRIPILMCQLTPTVITTLIISVRHPIVMQEQTARPPATPIYRNKDGSKNIIAFPLNQQWSCTEDHCATSRKVAASFPDVVTGIFHWNNPSGRTVTLGLTQPLTEMSTRNISWGVKAAGAYGWQPYYLHVLTVLTFARLKPQPGAVQACNGIALPFVQKMLMTFIFLWLLLTTSLWGNRNM